MGNLLHKEVSILFGGNKNPDKTDLLGFNILCMLSGFSVNEAIKLRKKFNDLTKEKFLINIKNIILDAAKVVSRSLEEWLVTPNKTKINYSLNYMYYHMIISYIKMNNRINFTTYDVDKISNRNLKKFKSYLPHWMLNDLITKYWDKNRRVSDLFRLVTNDNELNRYTVLISKEDWNSNLFNWMSEQNNLKKLSNVSIENKIFLNFMHKLDLEHKEYFESYKDKDMEIEHIVPKLVLDNYKNEVPISLICNLIYMTDGTPHSSLLKIIKYPSNDELKFLKYADSVRKDKYKQFLTDRANFLSSEL